MDAQQLKAASIFDAAVELANPAERAAYLDAVCGQDARLRAEVEELLKHDNAAGSFLDRSDPRATTEERSISEGPGTLIGAYKLLEQIGEGGFGVVFLAEQQQPVRRKVALKVLKPGMDTKQVVARFEAERQALAIMDHPNIAKVHDGGATASGRPYFVMELVKGVPITDFCDQNKLTTRQRLELFVPLCQAVQHAHQKGIIHRDLKPSNVLVSVHDTVAVIKVIDFGVAKALGQELTDKTLFTGFAQMIGTPLYMSPEQAGQSGLDIDTRSDIYSLGVLLYELLTGTTPFTRERLQQAGYDEIRRIIREEEPQRPSTRISTLGQAASTLSAQRQSDPRKLTQLLRGELDWIVMKCLEKDRNRRYETANGLAMDVQRFLADEPVLACPPSAWYRLRKFVRRRRAALATATLLGLAVLLAGGNGLWLLGQHVARDRDAAGHLEEAERWERQGDWPQALRAVERAEGRLAGGGPYALRRRAEHLRERAQLVSDLEESRLQRSAVRDESFDHVGADQAFAELFKAHGWDVEAMAAEEVAGRVAASPIRVQLVAALDDWADVRSIMDAAGGERLRAIAGLADDDDWRRQLRDPVVRRDRVALERLARQEGVLDQPPVSLHLLAWALVRRGNRAAAEGLLRRAQQRHPDDFWINHDLAFNLARMKSPRLEEVIRFYQAAVALRPQSPGAYLNLANALRARGKSAESEAACRKAIALKPDYAAAYSSLCIALTELGRPAEAEAACRKAIALKPAVAQAYVNLGAVLRVEGRPAEAEAACRKAIALKQDLPQAHVNLGAALRAQGKLAEAQAAYHEAIALKPDNPVAYNNLGILLRGQGKRAEAQAAFRKAIALKPDYGPAYTSLGITLRSEGKLVEAEAAFRKTIELKPDYPEAYVNLGMALRAQRRPAEAEAACRKAIELRPNYAEPYAHLGGALRAQGRLTEGEAACRKAIDLKPDYAEAHCNLGVILQRQGRFAEAVASLRRGHELSPQVPDWSYPSAELVREAEQLLALDGKLPRVLKGEAQPAGVGEQLALARLCVMPVKRQYAAAARFYAAAFAAEPRRADDLRGAHRYNAACAAALAGCGQGEGAAALDDRERARLRQQAVDWLRTDLAARTKLLDRDPERARTVVAQALRHWQADADLAGLRDQAALDKLPEAERAACQKLWADVGALLARLRPGAKGAPPDKP
jgi:serine/threonine-protein kinase